MKRLHSRARYYRMIKNGKLGKMSEEVDVAYLNAEENYEIP
jgi:hypothetical protein